MIRVAIILLLAANLPAQGPIMNWAFGNKCGLSFSTTPPASFQTSITAPEGCASISDAGGNLLFYSDGVTIWNRTHQVMQNGSGLFGGPSSTQAALIIKKPLNNNEYFLFTTDEQCGPNGVCYNIVDMSLASGNGSVTIKNQLITTGVTEKIAATLHCNQTDFWVLVTQCNSNVFKSYLVTNGGVNSTPVISSVGPVPSSTVGAGEMKISPNGNLIASVCASSNNYPVVIYNFDPSTGFVSNPLPIQSASGICYGCSFSPDGSKLYVSKSDTIVEWDVCGASGTAIVASRTGFRVQPSGGTTHYPTSMQIGPDGKVYVSMTAFSSFPQAISVINAPNQMYPLNAFTNTAIVVSPGSPKFGLPNFPSNFSRMKPASISHSISCGNITLTCSPTSSCTSVNPVQQLTWHFGDAQTQTLTAAIDHTVSHTYASNGIYKAKKRLVDTFDLVR
jgi:hypothetical protein